MKELNRIESTHAGCRQDQGLRLLENRLAELADQDTAAFFSRLAPTISKERILGIRKPQLLTLAGTLDSEQIDCLLHAGFNRYYEEDILQIHFMNQLRSPDEAAACLDLFVDRVNSWALCDGLTFPKLSDETLLSWAEQLLDQPGSYRRRLGLLWILKRVPGSSMDAGSRQEWIEKAMKTSGDEKEVTDIKGWLLCEMLIHDPDLAWPFFEDERLDQTVRRCAIQKSIESRRIDARTKSDLKQLRSRMKAQNAQVGSSGNPVTGFKDGRRER